MGGRISRRREAPANSAETAATEQKTAEEPAATQPAEDSGTTQTQGAIETENLDVVVQEAVTPVASLPSEECVAECKEVKAPAVEAPLNDAVPEAVVKDTPAPVQPEPLVSISEPSPPEPESAAVSEVQLDPEPASEALPEPEPMSKPEVEAETPEPVPEPEPTSKPEVEAEASEPAPEPEPTSKADAEDEASEPVSEPEPTSNPEAVEPIPEPEPTSNSEADEPVPEPISESVPLPAEAPEQQTDMVTQESLPEPEIASPALIDLGVPDATPEPINTPPCPDEPSDISVTEECQATAEGTAEVSVISTLEPEKSEETSECLEKPVEVEAAGNLEQLVSDVSEESVRGLLQNLELKGSDLVADLIPNDVKIPDDTPITDMSITTELM